MRLLKLEVREIGPHAARAVDLDADRVGIFGPNGSGKTTLLSTVYATLTGDWTRLSSIQSGAVRTTATGPASTTLAFAHRGGRFRVVRRPTAKQSPLQAVLEEDGAPTTTGPRAVNDRIHQVLGVDAPALAACVFKLQGRLDDFILAAPAARADLLARLCRVDRCEPAHEFLGARLRELEAVVLSAPVEEGDRLAGQLAERQSELDAARIELVAAAKGQLTDVGRERARAVVQRADGHVAAAARLEAVRRRHIDVTVAVNEAEAELAEARSRVESLNEACAAGRDDHAARAVRLADTAKARALWEEAARHRKAYASAKAKLAALPADQNVAGFVAPHHDILAGLADHLASNLPCRCPLCDSMLQKDDRVRVTDQARALRLDAAGERSVLTQRMDNASRALGSLGDPSEPSDDSDDRKAAEEYVRQLGLAEGAERAARAAKTRADQCLAKDRQVYDELTKVEASAGQSAPDPVLADKARAALRRDADATARAAGLAGQVRQLEAAAGRAKDEFDRFQIRRAAAVASATKAATVTVARSAFHRSGLPRRVTAAALAGLVQALPVELAAFGSPFAVRLGEDLSLSAERPGEGELPASQLSTGLRAVLGLSFLAAVAKLWAGDLGLLCLDEPTANLDADHCRSLGEAIASWSSGAGGARQLIVVSHSEQLRPYFDRVIELG